MGLLQERRALITGGTTGLGFAIAERFLAEGAQVVITGRDAELGRRLSGGSGRDRVSLPVMPPILMRLPRPW